MHDSGASDKVKAIRTEVYSRIVGYYRPVQNWNRGKREEFSQRVYVDLGETTKDAR